MYVTLQLMSQTSGGGKSFKTWKTGLVTSVPAWDRVSFAKGLEEFCAACVSMDDNFHERVSKLKLEGSESLLKFLVSIRTDALPDLWETAKADFPRKIDRVFGYLQALLWQVLAIPCVGPIFRVVDKGLNSMLDEAVSSIPPQVDKLIQSRNVVAIKNTLFNRQTHLKAGFYCHSYLHSSSSV